MLKSALEKSDFKLFGSLMSKESRYQLISNLQQSEEGISQDKSPSLNLSLKKRMEDRTDNE